MSIIGSSPGIRVASASEISALRAVGSSDSGATPMPTSSVAVPASPVMTSTVLNAGGVPVDQTRVATIKKAIETNSYPISPARIGDAMIAAGMLLRMAK